MNKLMVVVANLLIVVSAVAMELVITKDENTHFLDRLHLVVNDNKKLVREHRISQKNPIHLSLLSLSEEILPSYKNDVKAMLTSEQYAYVKNKIDFHKQVDSNELIQFFLDQIREKVGDIQQAQKLLIQEAVYFQIYNSRMKLHIFLSGLVGAMRAWNILIL